MKVYEFEFYGDDGSVLAIPFDLEGATFGDDMDDAIESAADWLAETLRYAMASGDSLPDATHGNAPMNGGIVIAIAVDVSASQIESVSAADAARMLGVSRPRVSQLCKSGALFSWNRGTHVMVSVDSVNARIAESLEFGRSACNQAERQNQFGNLTLLTGEKDSIPYKKVTVETFGTYRNANTFEFDAKEE